jgi:ankyrin repeat protein
MYGIRRSNCGDVNTDSLFFAAGFGDLAEVKRLVVGCGVNPNIKDKDGNTPLHYAAREGRLKVVELLLEHGADPNIQDKDGWTPLHYAAWKRRLKVVELLLEHGADPNIQDKDGETPLHLAAWDGHLDVVKFLLEHGANPNIQENKYGKTPLHYAVSRCLENKFGRTLLHFTVSRRNVDVARVLLDHGADPTISDNEGMTPLELGRFCEELREMLRRGDSRTMVYE